MEKQNSYYQFSRNQVINQTSLKAEIKADLCVIGGGISGLSTAIHAREMGLKVALVEASTIGFGASGRSGGQMIIGYNQSFQYLQKKIGKDDAKKLWLLGEDAIKLTRSLIKKYKIDCDLTDGHYHVGTKMRHQKELIEYLEDLNQAGYNKCHYLNQQEIREKINSDCYYAGVYDSGSGHLHPLNYTLGLAKSAIEAGVDLYENTQVTQIKKRKVHFIKTTKGSIVCANLAICCNAYLDGLETSLDKKIMPVKTYIIATEKMSETEARGIISDNAAVADINFVLNYYRFSKDNRLLFGGRVNYSGLKELQLVEKMRKLMVHFFPSLREKRIEFSWGGNVAITINRLPHLGRLGNNIYFAQGYSGHGIALAALSGKVIAQAIQSEGLGLKVFEKISHQSFLGGKLLRTPLLVLSMAYYKLRDLI